MDTETIIERLPPLLAKRAGPLVEAWQTFLIEKGHYPKGKKPDGMYGNDATAGTKNFQKARGLTIDGKVGHEVYVAAAKRGFAIAELGYGGVREPGDPASILPAPGFEPVIVDHVAVGTKELERAAKNKNKALRADALRDSSTVEGIVLHQMACYRKGDGITDYDEMTAHYVITQRGEIAQLHRHDVWLYASNGLNGTTIAVEFAGKLADVDGKWWQENAKGSWPGYLTPWQVSAGRHLLKTLKEQGVIQAVYGHIQADGENRTNCPGPDIWASVGQWGVDKLGLSDGGPGFVKSTTKTKGAPIPDAWRTWGARET